MQKSGTRVLFSLLLAVLLFLCGCSARGQAREEAPLPSPSQTEAVQPTPASTPEPTPASTPEPTPEPTEWTLSDESAEEILALADMPSLKRIDAGESREYEALLELRRLLPDCEIHWRVPLQGESYPDDTEELTLSSTEGLEEAVAGLPELRFVDLTACQPELDLMDRLYDRCPETEFLFTFTMGREGHRQWEIRSDCTCFSTLWSGEESYRYNEEDYYPLLRFCRHLRALDLGHSDIRDISLIGEHPDLRVLILADNPHLTDIRPLNNLHELTFLELFLCFDIDDFSCLYGMPHMIDLNLSYCKNLDSVAFLDNMPDFSYGWFRNTKVTHDMVKPYQESREGLRFVVGSPEDPSSTLYGWRGSDQAKEIRHAFYHWREVEDFRAWDDIVYRSE